MCPLAHSDGHDAPRLIAKAVPGFAAEIDDLIIRLEDAVRQPVVAHELPDILDWVQFGSLRRQWQNGDVFRQMEFFRRVPASLIDDQNRMGSTAVAISATWAFIASV